MPVDTDVLAVRAREVTEPLAAGDTQPVLALARELGSTLPHPGSGETLELWRALGTIASVDLGVARAVEPHLDALHILAQCPSPPDLPHDATFGVFAAEGPGTRLEATPDGDRWRLSGRKPWCSLAQEVSHALVTAHVDGGRRLFAVDLAAAQPVAGERWVSRGLASIPSCSLDFDGVDALPVGDVGWYLERPGFWWGGMGVAAIWTGGAAGLARALAVAAGRREPDQVAQMHVGALDHRFAAASALFAHAATSIDDGTATGASGERLFHQVRRTAAELAEEVLRRVGHGLGPGPLATDETHARRVADLEIYIRQDHAERDDAALGRAVLASPEGRWHA